MEGLTTKKLKKPKVKGNRSFVTTTKGCIDADMVEQFKNLHDKTQVD